MTHDPMHGIWLEKYPQSFDWNAEISIQDHRKFFKSMRFLLFKQWFWSICEVGILFLRFRFHYTKYLYIFLKYGCLSSNWLVDGLNIPQISMNFLVCITEIAYWYLGDSLIFTRVETHSNNMNKTLIRWRRRSLISSKKLVSWERWLRVEHLRGQIIFNQIIKCATQSRLANNEQLIFLIKRIFLARWRN